MQRVLAFRYTNSSQAESPIINELPFTIAIEKNKILGVQLTTKVNYLYKENYKPLLKEIIGDTKNEKAFNDYG